MSGTVVEAVRLELVEMEKAGVIDGKALSDSLRYLRDSEDEVATWHANGNADLPGRRRGRRGRAGLTDPSHPARP